MLFAREFSERSRYFLCGDQFINSHTVKALLSDYLKKWWQLELVTYENELWWATTMLFYMVKQYRVVAYKSIRNSFIKKIKSNLCLTNVFIHVSGCRHSLSLHPNFLEQNNPKYRTALWCTVQDLNQQTISTVCSFMKVLIYINKYSKQLLSRA